MCEVFEHPIIFESVEDGVEQFSGGGDDGFTSATCGFDVLVETMQIWAITLGNQRALHQRGAGDFVVALGNASNTLNVIGLADAWCNTKVSGKIATFGKIFDRELVSEDRTMI